MEKRRFTKNNEGYSLIELIIVIAVIAALTTAAFATMAIMKDAKTKEASSTLEDELSALQSSAKDKMCIVSGVEQPDYSFALMIYRNGGTYYAKKGYYVGGGADVTQAASYVFVAGENTNGDKGASFSSYVSVKYDKGTSGTSRDISSSDPVYIIYDRHGMCKTGDGTYTFYRKGSENVPTATLVLNKNGSCTSK